MSTNLVALVNGEGMRREFLKALNKPEMVERFLRLATTAINSTPKLKDCSSDSVLGGLLRAAQLNLEPNTILGECFLIPRVVNKKLVASFELGYKGLIRLVYRSGQVKLVQAYTVYENDLFDIDYGENLVVHKPNVKLDRGEPIGYWARYFLSDGTQDFRFWTVRDVVEHAKQYSKSFNSDYSPWATAFDQMALKTVLKDTLRYAPVSIENLANALAEDQTPVTIDTKDLSKAKPESTTDLFLAALSPSEPTEQVEAIPESCDEVKKQKVDSKNEEG